jgi:hypothetical protein
MWKKVSAGSLTAFIGATMITSPAVCAGNNLSEAAKAVGRGVLWLPKKVVHGVKGVGKVMKKKAGK